VRAVFEERGLFEEVRAKDVTDYRAQDGEILAIGSAGAYMWNTWLTVEEGEGTANVAPAYVQTYVETGAGETTARITALAAAMPDGMGMYPVDDDLRFRLYARRAEPILYHVEGSGPVQVERDDVLDPAVEVEETPEGPMERVTWTLEGLDPDTRYYLHVVGYGLTPGVLMSIDVSLE